MINLPTVTFTAGCGGSGKSSMLKKRYPNLSGIDSDIIKANMPGYDPKNPQQFHEASSQVAMRQFYAALGAGKDFFFDGTGKNVEKYVGLIAAAKAAGFRTRMFLVKASLETCLKRNAARERTVPIEIIVETHQALDVAQAVLKNYVDEYEVVLND